MKPLRAYQSEACDAIDDEWTRVRSTLLVAATGTGKTRMGCEVIARRAPAGRTLWLAHRSELLDQAQSAIAENTGLRVGREQAQKRSQVRSLWGSDDSVVVGSIQTMHSDRLIRFFKPDDFATVIVDEAHHALSRSYRDVLAYFAHAKILGVTATPDRGDKLGLFQVFDTVAYQYEILQAITDGYLCDLDMKSVEVVGLDLSKCRTAAGDLNAGDLAKLVESEATMHAWAGPIVEHAGFRPTVVFTPTVESAHHLASVMRGYTSSPIRAIDGNTASSERAEALALYQSGEVQFLINCALLTEGWDAPHTSCVAICRPTKSRALYAQMVGRGTRIYPGKKNLLVIDLRPEDAGRHYLVSPLDILGGKDLDDDVATEARRLNAEGMPATEALASAEAAKAERQRNDRIRDEMRRNRAQVVAEQRIRQIDPFGCVSTHSMIDGAQPSSRTMAELSSFGVDTSTITAEAAAELLPVLRANKASGRISYKMARHFVRWGLRTDVPMNIGKTIISTICANGPNGWRNPVPAEIIAKWGVKK